MQPSPHSRSKPLKWQHRHSRAAKVVAGVGMAVALASQAPRVSAQAIAAQPEPKVVAAAATAQDDPASLRAVLTDPLWVRFSQWVLIHHVTPLNDASLRGACQAGLTKKLTTDAAAPQKAQVLACIEAAVASLGEQSSFLDPAEFAVLRAGVIGNRMAAVGLELAAKPIGSPQPVVAALPGGPGERAGFRANDQIIQIDDIDVRPLSHPQTLALLRGPVGSTVHLTVLREGQAEPQRISVQREIIRPRNTALKRLTEQVLYLRVSRLAETTASELEALLEGERAAASAASASAAASAPAGLILDLRTNTGGLLDGVADLAYFWAEPQTLVVSLKRHNHSDELRTTNKGQGRYNAPAALRLWLQAVPLVVLVDDKTAAGAEALAQFLRETQAATLMGLTTFGAPQVRTLQAIGSDAAANIHSANMVSPAGLVWPNGLVPDRILERAARRHEWGDEKDPWLEHAIQALAARRKPTR